MKRYANRLFFQPGPLAVVSLLGGACLRPLPPRLPHRLWLAYVSMAAGVLGIALAAILVKWAAIPGEASAFWRMLIATTVLFPWWMRHRPTHFPGSATTLGVLGGVCFGLDIALWQVSLLRTSAANATLLANIAPLWVGLGALLFFRDRPPLIYWFGMTVSIAGVVLIMSAGYRWNSTLDTGDILALSASLFYAGYLLATQRARMYFAAPTVFMLSLLGSVAILLPLCLLFGTPLAGYSGRTWVLLFALALVPQLGCWFAVSYALGHLRATVVSVSLLGGPVLTALFAVPLLGEYLTRWQILGGALVLVGVYLVNRRTAEPDTGGGRETAVSAQAEGVAPRRQLL